MQSSWVKPAPRTAVRAAQRGWARGFRTMLPAVALLIAAGCAPRPKELTEQEKRLNLDSFEHVWATVRDKHWDPQLGGLNWQAVHDELRPRVETAKTDAAARAVMGDMLGRLRQSHFGIIPRGVYEEVEKPKSKSKRAPQAAETAAASRESEEAESSHDGVLGIDALAIGDHAIVSRVWPDSAAAAAGVKPGWEIVAVAGDKLAPAIKQIRTGMADSKLLELVLTRAVNARLHGAPGKSVAVEFSDGGTARTHELAFQKPPGTPAQLGNLPTIYLHIESRWAAENVGYFAFSIFLDPPTLMTAFQEAIKTYLNADGIIIDLRGNGGGIGGLSMGMAGWFFDSAKQQLGTMIMRNAKLNFVINPRVETFKGPLAILVDGSSASTSEIFAGGLKDLGRARIFGRRTAAAALPSMIERLPNGDGFQYAIADYVSVGGKPLEGIGVIPDEEISPTRQDLLDGRDPVIDAAVRWIRSQKMAGLPS